MNRATMKLVRASRTKVSREDRNKIVRRACAQYRLAAKQIAQFSEHPEHAKFEGDYALRFVWAEAGKVLGEDRAENVSNANYRKMAKEAISYHNGLVAAGIITERGHSGSME